MVWRSARPLATKLTSPSVLTPAAIGRTLPSSLSGRDWSEPPPVSRAVVSDWAMLTLLPRRMETILMFALRTVPVSAETRLIVRRLVLLKFSSVAKLTTTLLSQPRPKIEQSPADWQLSSVKPLKTAEEAELNLK